MRAHNNHAVRPRFRHPRDQVLSQRGDRQPSASTSQNATNAALPSVKVLDMRIEKENVYQVMLSRTLETP